MFDGVFKRESVPTGMRFSFEPQDTGVEYELTIEDAGMSFTRDPVNPALATKMHFEDLDTHCAFRQSSHIQPS